MNCDDARATLHRLTGQTPHTPTSAEMRELAEADAPAGTHTRAAVPRSWYSLGHYVSGALETGRRPYSKPRVTCFYFSPTIQCWDVECGCGWLDMDLVNWQAAMDAALAHVREHHQPNPCDGGPVDLDELEDQIDADPATVVWSDLMWQAWQRIHEALQPAAKDDFILWPPDPYREALDRAYNQGGRS